MKNANGLRETKDSELVTPEAIRFRIERIKAANPVMTPACARRVEALRQRLPSDPNNSAVLAPAINPNLLISKRDVDEYSKRPQLYA